MKFALNLASHSYVNRKALYLVYGLVGGLLLLLLLLNLMTMYGLQRTRVDITQKIADLQFRAGSDADMAGYSPRALAELRQSIVVANELLQRDSFRWTQLLDRLEKLVPTRVRIRSISPDYKKKSVAISCEAKDLAAMNRFIDKLNQSGLYDRVLLSQQAFNVKTSILSFNLELFGGF